MKLMATKSFAGLRGSAGEGQSFEVDEETARLMLDEGYPVAEVEADEAKPARRKRSARTPARD
jgi:hypothetical protein